MPVEREYFPISPQTGLKCSKMGKKEMYTYILRIYYKVKTCNFKIHLENILRIRPLDIVHHFPVGCCVSGRRVIYNHTVLLLGLLDPLLRVLLAGGHALRVGARKQVARRGEEVRAQRRAAQARGGVLEGSSAA